tara:strand:- start:159 stop:374 length:216 start_codon:yes stop_codon:yes gene_type:complete
MIMEGFPINWAYPKDSSFKLHPLYIKYNNLPFNGIDANLVKADLNGVIATAESASVCAYLSWLLRTLALLA